jgi:hypothetical protein
VLYPHYTSLLLQNAQQNLLLPLVQGFSEPAWQHRACILLSAAPAAAPAATAVTMPCRRPTASPTAAPGPAAGPAAAGAAADLPLPVSAVAPAFFDMAAAGTPRQIASRPHLLLLLLQLGQM